MQGSSRLSSVARLAELGCVPYLDTLDRSLITSGALRRLIEQDRISGVTTNPVIFGKAINNGQEYESDLFKMAAEGKRGDELFLQLMVDDVRAAADELTAVYRRSARRHGYVSLEVLPELANDTDGTIAMAKALWARVDRPNLLIKVPATAAGILAVEELVAAGVNVNVTTIFSTRTYEDVFWAYVRGQLRRDVPDVVSVASFFVSRIDNVVDRLVEDRVTEGSLDSAYLEMRGQAALASVRLVYELYRELHRRPEASRILERGGLPQQPLWASMLPRNPAYRDVKYVEGVALPGTIATIPLTTLGEFRDHGIVDPGLPQTLRAAHQTIDSLAAVGITMDSVAEQLLSFVLNAFEQAIVDLRVVVEKKLQASVSAQ
jgi:transaldolase